MLIDHLELFTYLRHEIGAVDCVHLAGEDCIVASVPKEEGQDSRADLLLLEIWNPAVGTGRRDIVLNLGYSQDDGGPGHI